MNKTNYTSKSRWCADTNQFSLFKLKTRNYRGLKNQDKMIGWVLRQYFDPEKNKNSRWYKPGITEHNVLAHIANPTSLFPLTPHQLGDMWHTIESFKKSLTKAEKSMEGDLALPKHEEEKNMYINPSPATKYQLGEATLKNIGALLGGLTPTMINKLGTSAMEKFRVLTDGVSLERIDEAGLYKLNKNISKCRHEAAIEFAGDLKRMSGQTKSFIGLLRKKHILTQNDIKTMTDEEVASLALLSIKPREEIVRFLLKDISSSNNILKTFQSAVAKKAFPEKKRGRPRKKLEIT